MAVHTQMRVEALRELLRDDRAYTAAQIATLLKWGPRETPYTLREMLRYGEIRELPGKPVRYQRRAGPQ